MNKERRKKVTDAIAAIGKIEELIQNILDEEQEAFDNMPEGLQTSDNGIVSEEAQENLDAAIDALEEAISYLEEI
jgi:hypothetical protein